MLSAGKFILQLRHLFLCTVQDAAKLVRQAQVGSGAMDFRTALQLRAQLVTKLIYVCSNLLKKRPRYAFTLVQKRGEKMLIRDFRMIGLRSQVLRRLQRLLHLLRVFIDAHASTYERERHRQLPTANPSHAFDTNASTTMSVCDERGSETDNP